MASLIGTLVGGLLIVLLIALALGRFAFHRHGPTGRAGRATAAAWLLCGILGGFGMADARGFVLAGFVIYAVPSLVVFGLLRRRYRSARGAGPVADPFE